ncbi:ankyrin repeat domain-containing protein [Roseibacillus persicicus]|uniref:ankyrin repeat domain-containing protein n=1 Tax=Roseibacillus persicicus TaxID=454148 RepID=UPI00280CF0E3|nr:ankyrin repeat domain-containing protein [Roseibacillus persicicus]MDQ8191958.1 ankyrin repeat domain-containing protein [Roseibacillus persicicus]
MEKTPNSQFQATALHQAAENGEGDACRQLIADKHPLNPLNEQGWTPLLLAVMADNIETVALLLDSGCAIEYRYQREDTPDERARIKESTEALFDSPEMQSSQKELLSQLPPELVDDPLFKEAFSGHPEGFDEIHFEVQTEHAIEHASSLAMLKLLIERYQADVNHVGPDGYWPLSTFAESDDLVAVEWLLSNGADPNLTSTGETAIFKAVRNDNLEMVQLLHRSGARLDVQDVDGWTVLCACQSLPVAKWLIENGADPRVKDQVDFPCWHWVEDPPASQFLKEQALRKGPKKWNKR